MSARCLLVAALLLAVAGSAPAQINWSVTYADAVGSGFNATTVPSGETLSLGALRKNSVTAAFNYMGTVLDGRGTVALRFNTSLNTNNGVLASFGQSFGTGASNYNGTFTTGPVYDAARTGVRTTSANVTTVGDGNGQVNFVSGLGWNYAGQTQPASGGSYDLVSVLAHEIGHSFGFLSLGSSDGVGLFGNTLGTPGWYSTYDQWLQQGSAAGTGVALHNRDWASSGYTSYIGPTTADGSGNLTPYVSGNTGNGVTPANVANGLYFAGPYAQEVYGGPVPLYAPTTLQGGSSVSHTNTGPGTNAATGLMTYAISANTVRRFQPYEKAMLYDMGWNQYEWANTTGAWSGATLAASNWRTSIGTVAGGNLSSSPKYNGLNNPNKAPVLPPLGTTVGDVILTFGDAGALGYTSTNDLGTVRASRVIFINPSAGLANITGGTLILGQNGDGTATTLTPKILQNGAGPAALGSALVIPTGRLLRVEGTGAGPLTLSGGVSGGGAVQKDNTFTLTLAGPTTFTGATTLVAGPTVLTGTGGLAGSSPVTVGLATGTSATLDATAVPGGFALTAGQVVRGAGTLAAVTTVVRGGTLQGGNLNAASGTLTVSGGVTVTTGSTVRAAVDTGGASTLVAASGAFTAVSAADVFTVALQPDAGLTLTPGAVVAGPWTVFTFGSTTLPQGSYTASGGGAPFTVVLTNGTALNDWSATVGPNSLVIASFTPVPEPALLLPVLAAGLWVWRRVAAGRTMSGCSTPSPASA